MPCSIRWHDINIALVWFPFDAAADANLAANNNLHIKGAAA